jgi:hypothetical protein
MKRNQSAQRRVPDNTGEGRVDCLQSFDLCRVTEKKISSARVYMSMCGIGALRVFWLERIERV